ncbi:RWD domain containing [Orbilia ellipsospora]|uniref:RWD domain containing n=1 Tax=Orbilia ellipsospora TaxID=2528407 RepID=A0AAV9WYM5_9PEZI
MLFSRAFFMFHHIRARRKRDAIRSLAESMDIRGVCKHGYPGFLYVEGEDTSIQAYIKEIKRMKWQSVEVRRKETANLPNKTPIDAEFTRLAGPLTIIEVETSKEMSEILRTAGLGDFLRKAMVGASE